MLNSLAADLTVVLVLTAVLGLALDFHLNGHRPRR